MTTKAANLSKPQQTALETIASALNYSVERGQLLGWVNTRDEHRVTGATLTKLAAAGVITRDAECPFIVTVTPFGFNFLDADALKTAAIKRQIARVQSGLIGITRNDAFYAEHRDAGRKHLAELEAAL